MQHSHRHSHSLTPQDRSLLSIQERRQASSSISASPIAHSLSASPLALSDATRSAAISKGRYLWAPHLHQNVALPSPMAKAERELRSQPPRLKRFVPHLTLRSLALLFLAAVLLILGRRRLSSRFLTHSDFSAIVQDVTLPLAAGPVSFTDSTGLSRWTMFIPDSSSFPLRISQYRAMYDASRKISSQIAGPQSRTALPSKLRNSFAKHLSLHQPFDDAFMDVHEAQVAGVLPNPRSSVPGIEPSTTHNVSNICHSSITFVMGPNDVRFGKTLLSLWFAYGVAKHERRSFFIDDHLWPYGRYTDFFKPVRVPSCSQAPSSEILPYPHSARHLIVSSATWSWSLGDMFHGSRFQDMRKSGKEQERRMFAMARRGYQDLFRLNDENQALVDQRVSNVRLQAARSGDDGVPVIGVHIRRGDLHPAEHIYSRDYLPYERYGEAALEALQRSTHMADATKVPILVASDDPDTIVSPDLLASLSSSQYDVQNAQSHILLASQRSLERKEPIRAAGYIKHVDENSGWEGGFFASLFNGLGKARSGESTFDNDVNVVQDEEITNLKRLIGRSYLLDLAVLSRSDVVVCAVSSATCRALGVMMGWDKVTHGRWINVDDGRSWTFD